MSVRGRWTSMSRPASGSSHPWLGLAVTVAAALVIAAAAALPARAGQEDGEATTPVVVSPPVTPYVVDVDLRDLPSPPEWQPGMPVREVPRREFHPPAIIPPEPGPHGDPLADLQRSVGESWVDAFTTPNRNFTGVGFQGVNPSDPVGDVGPNHYIHASNSTGSSVIRIYDKAEPAPNLLASTTMSAIAGGTGACASGFGDPVVIHDQFADRWLLTEFASSGNRLCVYVSQTADPVVGGWYVYQFTFPSFPDYHKWGVWRNAYGMAANESSPSAYAFDRAAMLAGAAATFQRFTAPDLSGFGFQTLTPADIDGLELPPAGSPIPFIRHVDNEAHSGFSGPGDYLQLWFLDVDWVTPGNSTFIAPPAIQVTEFDSALCGLSSFYCIGKPGVPQGNPSSLDPLREPVMHRFVYRNFGSHEALVGNLATDVNGADLAGLRWFELRGTGSAWGLHQEGTYSLDSVNRWMGSIAMDGSGNIALGYSVSNSSSVFPGLRYAGRLLGDPPGTFPQGEASILEANANNGSNRWGDYASINVDPVDDCTFWFASKFGGPSSGQWSTRIASFKFDECGTPDFYLASDPDAIQVCAGSAAAYSLTVGSIAGFTNPVSLSASGNPAGTTAGFSSNPVAPPGSSTLTIGNTGSAAAGSYAITVDGTASGSPGHSVNVGLDVFTMTPGAPTLVAPANGALNVPLQPTFSWTAAVQAATYSLEVDDDPGFGSPAINESGISGTSVTPATSLASNTVYFWRVTADNLCGTGVPSTAYSFSTEALPGDCGMGTVPSEEFFDTFESGAPGWTHSGTGDSWALSTARSYSPANSFHANDPATSSDQRLVSPPVVLPVGSSPLTLQFWNWQLMEDRTGGCYDGGLVEISTDDGTTWTHLPNALMLTDPYDGPVTGLGNLDGWCDDLGAPSTQWKKAIVDIDAYAGQTARFRFRLGSDTSVSREGWYIDDVLVQSCDVVADFSLSATPGSYEICPGDSAQFAVSVGSTGGFANPVTLAASGQPAGSTAGFSLNPVTPPGSSTLTIGNTGSAAAGSYGITVSGTASGSPGHTTGVVLDVLALAAPPTLTSPPDGATGQPLRPTFQWSAAAGADSYWIQVDDDPAFGSPAISESGIAATSYTPAGDLDDDTTYYWRVTSENVCGPGAASSGFSFTTLSLLPFEDGFESGDTSEWSATMP